MDNKENKGTVKSSKLNSLWNRIGKKVAVGVVGFGLAVGAVFGFAGCNNTPTPTPPGPGPDIPPNPPIVVVEAMKMDNFLSEHHAIAEMFVEDNVRSFAIAENVEVKSEKCTLVASNSKEELHSVNFVYTVKLDETKRAVQVSTVTLNNDISFDKIVEHYSSQSKLASGDLVKADDVTVKTETIFEFDAKVNHDKQNIADAVYAVFGNTSDVKLFDIGTGTIQGYSKVSYLENNGSTLTVHGYEVRSGDTDEALIRNLNRPNLIQNKEVVSTHTIDGVEFYNTAYTLENIQDGSEKPDPGHDIEVTITKEEIVNALDTNCKENLVKRVFLGITIDTNKVTDGTWHITTNNDGKITQAEYSFTYTDTEQSAYYEVGKVNFNNPVDIKDLTEGKIGDVTYSGAYEFAYNPTVQEADKDIAKAICDTLFTTEGEKNVIARYIVDKGDDVGDSKLGYHHKYTVMEVTDTGINETGINIKKNSANDNEYISKLTDEANYRLYDTKSYTITGKEADDVTVKVLSTQNEATNETVKTRASSVRYAVTFGDDDIMYL